MSDAPAPLVPAEVDLRGLPFMPLDVVRLMDSDLFALASGDEFKAAVALWCKSWCQVPGASLPDDDRVLAHLSGASGRWKRLKPMAMRGWVLCSDGRWYHPVVAEKAAEAWKHRIAQRDRAAKRWHTHGNATASPTAHAVAYPTEYPAAMQGTGTVKGQGQGSTTSTPKSKPLAGESATHPARRRVNGIEPPTAATWERYRGAYEQRYAVEPVRNAKVNGMLAQFVQRVPADEAPAVAGFYVESNRGLYVSSKHCIDLMLRDAEGLRTEWATGRVVTDTEARQADRTQATGNAFAPLIEEARQREISNVGK